MFQSILFAENGAGGREVAPEQPAFFVDLNLDQIVEAVIAGRQEYDLKPFFHTPLGDVDAILYRQEVMQDLEHEALRESIRTFAERMRVMRRYLGLMDKLYFKYHKEGWFLEAAAVYCEAITGLARDLTGAELGSRGLRAFRDYLTGYAASDHFQTFLAETTKLKADLASIRYCVLIKGPRVAVRKYESEIDYSADVEATFAKFRQSAQKDSTSKPVVKSGMNHVEAQILGCVARLYPEVFADLDRYCAQHGDFVDETIRVFDREVEFYMAYLEHIARIRRAGLKFCYPRIVAGRKEVHGYETFDLALADKLIAERLPIVCNDFYLTGAERILVVTGPNQGGKTTFARTFGQLHYLARLGCPIPGREAQLFLSDRIFTHFEKEEDIRNLRGKLQDDLVRMYDILNHATPESIIIINEIFTSTPLHDAIFLSRKILERIIELDLLCVCVTFVDELASLGEKTVSMVSTVTPEDPSLRTYRIVRKPADGLAYALSIAEKRRLTYHQLKERLRA